MGIGRNFRIALLISLGVHILAMSAVEIIAPEDFRRIKRYPCVDFLGPILKKTAFDIMLENVNPLVKTTYRCTFFSPPDEFLKAKIVKRETEIQKFPKHLEKNMDGLVAGFLTGSKGIPRPVLDPGEDNPEETATAAVKKISRNKRAVVYRPEAPFISRDRYGDKETFRIKVRVLVTAGGDVKNVELVTTTGEPELDMIFFTFVNGWIFEPIGQTDAPDEWHEMEVVLGVEDNSV